MKKSLIITLHVGFWTCYALLVLLMLTASFQNQTVNPPAGYVAQLLFGFLLIPSAVAFYTNYFWLFPKFLQKRQMGKAIGFGIAIPVAGALLGAAWLEGWFGADFMFKDSYRSFLGELLFMIIASVISGAVGLVIRGFVEWNEEVKLREELTQKTHETELALVKAQLDPHFLFNTINNIDVLIQKDPEQASLYLNKLSDIMRFMLFETKTDEVSLSQEIEYIEKYLALQRIRTANDSYASFSVEGNPAGKKIGPMLLIPFIENAFKHTGNKKLENAIRASLTVSGNTIRFECENKVTASSPAAGPHNGLGNDLIRKRLELLYPNAHKLELQKSGETYRVLLTIEHD